MRNYRKNLSRIIISLLAAAAVLTALAVPSAAADLTQKQMVALLKEIDDRQNNSGDYKALVYMETKEKGKDKLMYKMVMYRRDTDDKLAFLFLQPKTEAGKGYLRIDKNFFMYDPTVGKWERRTERERIGGTDSRRADFDESRLAEEYTPSYAGEEKLGKYTVHHLKLETKKDADTAYPILHLWIDKETSNTLKLQEYALSGRLIRTAYYPKWRKVFSKAKGRDVYVPEQMRIYDEVEKGNRTIIVLQQVDFTPLPPNIFTKAWLESKSR